MTGREFLNRLRAALGFDRPRAVPATEWRPLDEMGPGARVVLRALTGDRELNSRFMQLGLVVGSAAEVLQKNDNGPMLLRARSTLVAVGRGEAGKIMVEVSS